MGTRSKGGVIVPLSVQPSELGLVEGIAETDAGDATQELLFTGRAECVPDCVQRLVSLFSSPLSLHVFIFLLERKCQRTGWKPSADAGSKYVRPGRHQRLSSSFGFFYARRFSGHQQRC
jgi:hypothetical protein